MQANSNFFDFDGEEVVEEIQRKIHFGQLLKRIAIQLHECATAQDEIAQVVSRVLFERDGLPNEDIVRLQAIDKTKQLLTDISVVLNLCSFDNNLKDVVLPEAYFAVLKLAELRKKFLAL
jgi:hypothetical protein